MNFAFFTRTFCEIHRFRSCHLRDTNVTILSQTRHENNRSENDDFCVFCSGKSVKSIVFAPVIPLLLIS